MPTAPINVALSRFSDYFHKGARDNFFQSPSNHWERWNTNPEGVMLQKKGDLHKVKNKLSQVKGNSYKFKHNQTELNAHSE